MDKLQKWTWRLLDFSNSLLQENFKNARKFIWTSSNNIQFWKVTCLWLQKWACHALFKFELKLLIYLLIFQLGPSSFRFQQLSKWVKYVVFTAKLSDNPFLSKLKKWILNYALEPLMSKSYNMGSKIEKLNSFFS